MEQPQVKGQKGFGYAFKQQIMKAWQPVPTLNSTIALFGILSFFFLVMGIVLISFSNSVQVNEQRYDALCKPDNGGQYGNQCTVTIALSYEMEAPIYLYYQLSNFYQNHRRYVKSKSYSQLSGVDLDLDELDECDPVSTNEDMDKTISVSGAPLTPNNKAIPCGLIAKSLFNDTFQLVKEGGTPVVIMQDNIAWPSDKNGRYNNVNGDWQKVQWIDMTNEHFMVWMRTAALPTFRKLWGRIETNLPAGKYNYIITNNYNVDQFDGQKTLVLSTTNAFGGKNEFLSIAYIVVGVTCSIITIGFIIRKYLSRHDSKKMK